MIQLRRYYYRFLSLLQRKVPYYDYIVPKQSKLLEYGQSFILTDDIEPKPINPNRQFDFNEYCRAIVSIINGTSQKCSIGIYGKWGTGKTTLMKLVEEKLKPTVFCWDKIVGQDKSAEQDTLKKYLYENFHGNNDIDIAWINRKDKEFNENDRYPKTITITNDDDEEISIKLTEKRKAILEINHRKIYEFTVEEEKIFYEERLNSNHNAQNISPYVSNVKENDILTCVV